MSFPLGWTVHPKYLNTNLHEGRMHLANYEALHPEPVSDPTKPLKVWVLMGGETSERQVRVMMMINPLHTPSNPITWSCYPNTSMWLSSIWFSAHLLAPL